MYRVSYQVSAVVLDEVVGKLLRKKVLQEAGLVAVDTTGGYVVFGPVWRPQDLPEGDTVLYGSVLSEVLQRFWESEEPPTADRRKPEDDECELFYQYNTARCPVEQALILRDELIAIMGSGGYELRKWLSSCPELLAGLPGEFHQDPHLFENPDNPNTLGILGVQYRPTHDVFTYKIEPDLLEKTWTKWSVLSTIARTFDPNGWIAPVTFMAKCFLQRLWLANLGWDDQLSGELLKDWLKFVTTLPGIVHIAIPRNKFNGNCARSSGYGQRKVAPVRTRWTIPKLELEGAALLVRLLNHVTCNLRGTINLDETVYAWTDSRIVLCWLQTSVHTLEVFVANRVSQITGSETPLVWRHVPGEWNPADCSGCRAPDLVSHPLWWGPQWLTESPQEWPFNECRAPLGPPDRGLRVNAGQLVPKPNPASLLERYSSLDKLLGVTGWIKRFVNNCRKPQAERNLTPVLSPAERNAALCSLVRVVQAEHFEEEVRLLRDGRGKLKGGMVRLNPFLDEQGKSSLSSVEVKPIQYRIVSSVANTTMFTELDCVWLLYCKNLMATAKLNAPYGTMARINGMALRMLTGELSAEHALDTMLYEALTGWTDLRCVDMFPRCSKVDAASVVMESILAPIRKSQSQAPVRS
ncbi:pao retrotransposon peptidase domain-containing protein [Phthorimaea operculella]|nr:pao retrotransposon peptidase domain-containing protein [Phthorimaea operculella]